MKIVVEFILSFICTFLYIVYVLLKLPFIALKCAIVGVFWAVNEAYQQMEEGPEWMIRRK